MILSCVYIKQRGIYLWGRDGGHVKGDSLQCNTVVSAADNCWSVHMHSGMGVCSEKWPWPEQCSFICYIITLNNK